MKLHKIFAGILAVTSLCSVMAMASCKKDGKYVATAIVSEDNEQYGFAIGKNASKKAEILGAMNSVIEDLDIEKVITYYTAVASSETPTVSLEFPDLSDNTAGTLQVYTNAAFEPFEFVDDDQNIVGADMYIMELVAEELNMKVKFDSIDFDTIVGKVATEDNAIGAAGITITDERKQSVDFSNTYYSTVQCIITKEGEELSTLDELKGKKIGVQKGTTGWLLVSEAIESGVLKDTGAEVIPYDNGPVAFSALKAAKCDVVVIDELPAKKLVK